MAKRTVLPKKRLARLKSVGFVFDGQKAKEIRERAKEGKGKEVADDVDGVDDEASIAGLRQDTWEVNFKCLRSYKERYSHVCPPTKSPVFGIKFGKWVISQVCSHSCMMLLRRILADALFMTRHVGGLFCDLGVLAFVIANGSGCDIGEEI